MVLLYFFRFHDLGKSFLKSERQKKKKRNRGQGKNAFWNRSFQKRQCKFKLFTEIKYKFYPSEFMMY